MSTHSTTAPALTSRAPLQVPWETILPLAVAMATADTFWTTTLRGAVGAIERTSNPFTAWIRDSLLTAPVYALAILAAFTIALRTFGPLVTGRRAVTATSLLAAAAGTLVGAGALALSSAYDFVLQSNQLTVTAVHDACITVACQERMRTSMLDLQTRSTMVGTTLLLATNVVLVAVLVASHRGCLVVGRDPARSARPDIPVPTSRLDDARLLLVATLTASAVVHACAIPDHVIAWLAVVGIVASQFTAAALQAMFWQPSMLRLAVAVAAAPLLLWLVARAFVQPPTRDLWAPVDAAHVAVGVLEAAALIIATLLLRSEHVLRRRAALSAHASWIALMAVVSIAVLGLIANSVAALPDANDPSPSQVGHSH